MLSGQPPDGACKQLQLAFPMGLAVLPHGGFPVGGEGVDDGKPAVDVLLRQRDALGVGHRHHLPHGAQHGVPGLAGDLEGAVAALVQHGGLVAAGVAHQLAPHMGGNIAGEGVREGDAVKKGCQPPQMALVLSGGHADGKLTQGRDGDVIALF